MSVPVEIINKLVEQCGGDFLGECVQYPKADWKAEVENDATFAGYWSWVVSQSEADGVDFDSLSGAGLGKDFDVTIVVTGEATEDEDEEVAGFYAVSITVNRDISESRLSDLERSEIAHVALDEFHDQVGIECLDDFSISVHLPSGALIDDDGDADFILDARANFSGSIDPSYENVWLVVQPLMQSKMAEIASLLRGNIPGGLEVTDALVETDADEFRVSVGIKLGDIEVIGLEFVLHDGAEDGCDGFGISLRISGYNALVLGGYQPRNYTEEAFITDINGIIGRVNDCPVSELVDQVINASLSDDTLLGELAADGYFLLGRQ